jgi:hypothetical protein
MFIRPKPYTCPKCGLEGKWSPHRGMSCVVTKNGPLCPWCYERFLEANVPVLEYTGPDLGSEGSEGSE